MRAERRCVRPRERTPFFLVVGRWIDFERVSVADIAEEGLHDRALPGCDGVKLAV